MNRTRLAISALAFSAAALATGFAEAHGRDDVQWSVTVGSPAPAMWVAPAPPVWVAPPPLRMYGPAPVYPHRGQRPTRWDRDGDGIPNRFDRVYNPRWDRDGDGVPNRYDRHDNNPRRH